MPAEEVEPFCLKRTRAGHPYRDRSFGVLFACSDKPRDGHCVPLTLTEPYRRPRFNRCKFIGAEELYTTTLGRPQLPSPFAVRT